MDMAGFVARFLAYGVACWLLFGPGAARGADRFAGMDPYIREAMQKWEIPGLAIAVVKDGELVLARGYGICELGKDRKVTKDTVFPIASCTKSFTAACVAMLVEEGKLGWDDPVAKHLPGFELSDPYLTKHVTLRDMLCHRIGLPWAELLSGDSREVLRRIKYIEPIADFRTRFTYSNAMYVVAGEVVAHASGQPWEQFVAERIFKPLHMVSTTVSVTDVEADRLALRHWNSDEGIVARPLARDPVRADGGIHSTVVDLAQWVKLQLAEGQSEGRRLLSEKTVREMHALQFSSPVTAQPRNIYTARFYGTGLGWQVLDYRGRKVIRHGGGWGAWVAMIPEEKLAHFHRCRRFSEEREPHDAAGIVIQNDCHPPTPRPALGPCEGRPRAPEPQLRWHRGQIHMPDMVGTLGCDRAAFRFYGFRFFLLERRSLPAYTPDGRGSQVQTRSRQYLR